MSKLSEIFNREIDLIKKERLKSLVIPPEKYFLRPCHSTTRKKPPGEPEY